MTASAIDSFFQTLTKSPDAYYLRDDGVVEYTLFDDGKTNTTFELQSLLFTSTSHDVSDTSYIQQARPSWCLNPSEVCVMLYKGVGVSEIGIVMFQSKKQAQSRIMQRMKALQSNYLEDVFDFIVLYQPKQTGAIEWCTDRALSKSFSETTWQDIVFLITDHQLTISVDCLLPYYTVIADSGSDPKFHGAFSEGAKRHITNKYRKMDNRPPIESAA